MSEPLVVTIPHRLGKDEAVARIKGGFGRAKGEFAHLISIQNDSWEGDRLSFAASALGQHAHGFIDVYEPRRAAGGDAALAVGALCPRGAAGGRAARAGVAGEEMTAGEAPEASHGLMLRSPPNGSAQSAARWQAPAGVSKHVAAPSFETGLRPPQDEAELWRSAPRAPHPTQTYCVPCMPRRRAAPRARSSRVPLA